MSKENTVSIRPNQEKLMNTHHNRRHFFRLAGLSTAVFAGCSSAADSAAPAAAPLSPLAPAVKARLKSQLAMASYTCRKFTLDQALQMTVRAGFKNIALKDDSKIDALLKSDLDQARKCGKSRIEERL
jgi:hypothetical protein